MNRNRTVCRAAALAVAALVTAGWHGAAAPQDRGTATREAPKFEVDASWPKVPNGWVLGQVSGAAIDNQDNVWVFIVPG